MKALRYTKRLVSFNTTSHLSNRLISKYLEMKLIKHGFIVEKIAYHDRRKIRKVNLVARKGAGFGGLAYFSHSDVVPAKKWFSKKYGPFDPGTRKGKLYGRGTCDMKGSIACMMEAAQSFAWDELTQPIYFVVTADEEVGFHGARHVVEDSKLYREMVDHQTRAIIGEPTSLEVVHAHKGSFELTVTARGKAAHSSTRHGVNANLKMIPFLAELKAIHEMSESNPKLQNELFDPPTLSMNVRIKDDSPALNVTPGKCTCSIYLRSMPKVNEQPVIDLIKKAAAAHELKIKVKRWGAGFITNPDSDFVKQSLKLAERSSAQTAAYGTDGGIFSELAHRIVLGPGDIAQAHTPKEWISLEQLEQGTEMYTKMIRHWCCK